MKFAEFSKYLQRLDGTASRIEITKILAELLKKAEKEEIDKVIYLSLGELAPSFRGIVFNLADQMVMRAISVAYDAPISKVKERYKKLGDLGLVSFELAKTKTNNLSVTEVYDKLFSASEEGGEGSQDRRVNKIADILKLVDPLSAKFITRIPVGKLRLGFSEKTIIDALALAKFGDKSKKALLQKAFEVMPDIGIIAKELPTHPIPKVGVPVFPMLAQRLNSPSQMVEKMGDVGIEPKFDGLRVQIHFKRQKNEYHAYTRNLHDISVMFPELAKIGELLHADEVILDSEGIGIDEKTKKILDFQSIMTRRRKHEISETAKKIPANFYVFDILYKDGKSLMDQPYLTRRKILRETITTGQLLKVDEEITTKDPKMIADYYTKEIKNGLEGIMVKKADSTYVPGRTGWRWVKMKQVESAEGKLSDTVDCIVMGYTEGKGKRAGFGIGQFLVGVIDEDGERSRTIKTVTKVGTGLTDDQFRELNTRLKRIVSKEKPKEYEVSKLLEPDYWVEPQVVVEIAADDITKSPNHTAGLALRFPRLVRFRDDKSLNEATTLGEVKKMYELQNK